MCEKTVVLAIRKTQKSIVSQSKTEQNKGTDEALSKYAMLR